MAGTLTISTLSDGTNSTSATNPIKGSARAWVNFVGSTGAVNNSFNVSSVTRSGAGDYYVNLTSAMPNTTYAIDYFAGDASGQGRYLGGIIISTTQYRIRNQDSGGAGQDNANNFSMVFSS